jgi:hypothetical protein
MGARIWVWFIRPPYMSQIPVRLLYRSWFWPLIGSIYYVRKWYTSASRRRPVSQREHFRVIFCAKSTGFLFFVFPVLCVWTREGKKRGWVMLISPCSIGKSNQQFRWLWNEKKNEKYIDWIMAIIQKNRKAILHTIEIGLFDRSIYVKPYKPKKSGTILK